MTSPELLWICVTAFVSVGVILTVLAGIMRLILILFPQKDEQKTDPVLIAAAATVLQSIYPGTRITRVEEIP